MHEKITSQRLVILGRNSKVWASLKDSYLFVDLEVVAIGHEDLSDFVFFNGDKVWVFSYSRSIKENRLMFEILARHANIVVIYVSSASTNIVKLTRCYNYPVAKYHAANDASRICNAIIVQIGWFYVREEELPSGCTAATSASELSEYMVTCERDCNTVKLFKMINRPFKSRFERALFNLYGFLVKIFERYPCILRPFDVILRLFNMKWYGYLYISNKLWSMTK